MSIDDEEDQADDRDSDSKERRGNCWKFLTTEEPWGLKTNKTEGWEDVG